MSIYTGKAAHAGMSHNTVAKSVVGTVPSLPTNVNLML